MELLTIGWREWISLPELGVAAINAKIDTGARSSSLHGHDIVTFRRRGKDMVRFKIFPEQRSRAGEVEAEATILEYRSVRSSSGQATIRPVIVTTMELLGHTWDIELTLANRDQMGFRMLVGREAIRGRMLVDAGRSYYSKRPARSDRKRKRKPAR